VTVDMYVIVGRAVVFIAAAPFAAGQALLCIACILGWS
jgi:hypothetical protein